MLTDVGPMKMISLVIIAILLFGPDRLPELIQNVAGFLRGARELSDRAKREIGAELGVSAEEFRRALDPGEGLRDAAADAPRRAAARGAPAEGVAPARDGRPRFDPDAT
ncbi:twin-arginine translocase TatA/TatE family subunit [Streptomyces sp. G45]|uniref:twin-arginine translocase TatA/TatE family subunit n=1 Tax=Streptomyces sp. G45 TaxID=3406627 RepID=UPI003C194D27